MSMACCMFDGRRLLPAEGSWRAVTWWSLGELVIQASDWGGSPAGAARVVEDEEMASVAKRREVLEEIFIVG